MGGPPVVTRNPADLFAKAAVRVTGRSDGTLLLASPDPLGDYPRCVGEYLIDWARTTPNTPFLCQRAANGAWQRLAYGDALRETQRIASWLLTQNVSTERPVAILSDNSIEHALLMLAAMQPPTNEWTATPWRNCCSRQARPTSRHRSQYRHEFPETHPTSPPQRPVGNLAGRRVGL